ncbi:hypothetical protein AOA59_29580 [Pseudomonas sp. 2822-15]|nr:hypothetical protein AOA59_29580 [Pseudomonas sp. 2822-15]
MLIAFHLTIRTLRKDYFSINLLIFSNNPTFLRNTALIFSNNLYFSRSFSLIFSNSVLFQH